MVRNSLFAGLFSIGLLLLGTAPAAATTFCVPGYHAACPNAGGNVASPDLEAALTANGSDGVPDRVVIDTFTYTDPDTLNPNGTDPLEILGAGTSSTVITSSTTANVFVMSSGFGERELTVRNLTIRVPASITSGGGGLSLEEGHLENVNIETLHPGTSVGLRTAGGVTYRGGRIYGMSGGTFEAGATTSGFEPGAFDLDQVVIDGAKVSLTAEAPAEPVRFTRGQLLNPGNYAVLVYDGGQVELENSVVQGGSFGTLSMSSADSITSHLDIDSSTVVPGDPTKPPIKGNVPLIANYGSLRIDVKNSIFRGFDSSFNLTAPTNQASIGNTHLAVTNSNFNPFGTRTGDGSTYIPFTNINQDPLFVPGGYSLSAGSPSIDSGNPFAILPVTDILGGIRPVDGDVDGVAVRDQGAYEYVPAVTVPVDPPPSCATDPALCPDPPDPPDTTRPTISNVKFGYGRSPKKGGFLKVKLSEAAEVKAIFKPKPRGKGRKKRKTLKLVKQRVAGIRKINIRKKRLKPGKYKLAITATDAAGNKSKTVRRTVKVKSSRSSRRRRR